MKKLLLYSLLAFYTQINAQNVGIGNPAPAEKLDVTGNINVTGTIKANGTDGTANQVLAKNASNNLAWVNTAHANNTRFKCKFSNTTNPSSSFPHFSTLVYNLNPTDVSMAGNGITINKSGLYHFDVFVQNNITSTVNPSDFPLVYLDFIVSNTPPEDVFNIYSGVVKSANTLNDYWTNNAHVSFDQYIQAPAIISIRATSFFTISNEVFGTINGHLISE